MIRIIIIINFILLYSFVCRSQKFVPYKDTSNSFWGIKNTILNKPVTRGKWIKPNKADYNDSIFVFLNKERKTFIVDTNGIELFNSCCFSVFYLNRTNFYHNNYPYDTLNEKRLVEDPFYNSRGEAILSKPFFIDYKQQCYPFDYYPCPSWRKIRDGALPKHLYYIQKGELKRWNKEIDSAVYYCKLAIKSDSLNPSVYFWGAKLFINNYQEKIFASNNEQYSNYYPWIKYCIDKADELENKNPYKADILRTKIRFYKRNLCDKNEVKLLKKRIRQITKQQKSNPS